MDDYIQNPKLVKRGKIVLAGAKKLRDLELKDLIENMILIGPTGPMGKIFGYHPDTYILCFLEDPGNRKILLDIIQGKVKGDFPLFPNFRPTYGTRGTLDLFWDRPSNKKLLAGAVQFYLGDNNALVVTHMSVKNKWRRNRVNSQMMQYLESRYPDSELLFHKPTEMGYKFMRKHGYQEFKPE